MSASGTRVPRLVLDTNIVVSGLLWQGPPRRLLALSLNETVAFYSSPVLLDELARSLAYPKFAARIARFGTTITALVAHYTALISQISPTTVPHISRDPDDDHVIACALTANANLIVSGDRDLLDIDVYQGIRIITARQALESVTNHLNALSMTSKRQ